MELEASLVEKLEELRKWQVDQQERLFKQQQEQRELLNIEQERMYQALGLSLSQDNSYADDTFPSKENDSNQSYNHRTPNISNRLQNESPIEENNRDSIQYDNSNEELAMPLSVPPISLRISASDGSSYIDLPQERGIFRKYMDKPAELSVEGIELFQSENISRQSFAIDDIPVPSPKKDFKTLLEEKLKDSDEQQQKNDTGLNKKTVVKRPFLKKGTGLARFRPTEEFKKTLRPRSRSLGANIKYPESTCSGKNGKNQKEELKMKNKSIGSPQKYKGASVIIPRKLNLINVDGPKKKVRSNSMSGDIPNMPQINNKMKYSDDSRSDLDSSKLETRIFEYMEEKAENSSFCSTSSAVIAFMQQSTPLKLKNIRKHLASQHPLMNSSIDENSAAESLNLSTPKQSQVRRSLEPKEMKTSKWDSGPFPKTEPIQSSQPSNVQRGIKSTAGQAESVEKKEETDMSMHVRFAEFNEYKTIGLTDTSTISVESQLENGKNENSWIDDSEDSDESESENPATPIAEEETLHPTTYQKNLENSENSDDYTTEEENSVLNDSEGTCYDEDNTITDLHEQVRKAMLQDTVEESITRCGNESQNVIQIDSKEFSDEMSGIVFKSELLKTRLVELEREIEIFRKENASLSTQRQKLHEEYRKKHRELKEKEEELNQEKIEMEKKLQDEKKRLAREKAAFENRMREAKEKNFQTKQEREENQLLRKQLDEIMDELSEKERRWNVAQARQRSQVRVLQTENTNLKQEIETLKAAKRGNVKLKRSNSQSNTKAIHQIGKLLHGKASTIQKKKNFDENFEPLDIEHKKSHSDDEIPTNINYNAARDRNTEKVIVYEPEENISPTEEEVEENHHTYKNVLKETQVNYSKKISGEIKKPQMKDTACQVVAENEEFKDVEIVTERITDLPKMHEKELIIDNKELKEDVIPLKKSPNKGKSIENKEPKQPPIKSYEEFIRDVINPRNNPKPSEIPTDLNNRPTMILTPTKDRKVIHNPPEESPNDKKIYQITENVQRVDLQTVNYRSETIIGQMDRLNICPTDSDLIPRREHQKPLPRPPENMTPRPDPVQVSCLSDMLSPSKLTKQQNIREVKHPDGHTEFWYPNGNVKKLYPDRNITKMIYYNGDVRETTAEGCIKYFYAATKTWHTTYPDGFEILEFPDGQEERRTKDGIVEVSFPDGSIRLMQPDGVEKWALPDGTIAETFPNGDKILSLPNGQREIHTTDHKRREYPDGTVKYVYPDGTQETRYSNGRVRMKDKDGNLLIDSHQTQQH